VDLGFCIRNPNISQVPRGAYGRGSECGNRLSTISDANFQVVIIVTRGLPCLVFEIDHRTDNGWMDGPTMATVTWQFH